ncbi:hypothetical protein V6N11_071723 [Hibiscus sabdariffa]|uniref:Uncharacterized protein n=1 Tax=Hibiscus sabdariffa TaxID=183260 RepID=A0ABR2U0X1_9ROSI
MQDAAMAHCPIPIDLSRGLLILPATSFFASTIKRRLSIPRENPIISIYRHHSTSELEAFLVAKEEGESTSCDIGVKKAAISKDLVPSKTNLMHKHRHIYVSRRKFRLTMFPSFVDPALVVAVVVIFLVNGPKKYQFLDKLPVAI